MKLAARDIAAFLKQPDAQSMAVLLYGPDSGLVRERARGLAAALLGKDADPINRIELSADQVKADPACLRDELCALSLMGGRRIVLLRDITDKFAGILESALEGLDTTTYLIVEAEELSASSPLRQMFEKAPRLAALACYRDEGRNLEEIIRNSLAQHGLRATSDAMHYLLSHLGNDRGITLSEMGKIALYMGSEKEVTLDIAVKLVGHNAAESMEDICHAVACGNSREAQALLASLLHEGVQPVAIVRSLLRHFQRLDFAAAHMAAGHTPESAIATLRPPVFFKYALPTKRALLSLTPRLLALVLSLLLKTERELKSGVLSPSLVAGNMVGHISRMTAA